MLANTGTSTLVHPQPSARSPRGCARIWSAIRTSKAAPRTELFKHVTLTGPASSELAKHAGATCAMRVLYDASSVSPARTPVAGIR